MTGVALTQQSYRQVSRHRRLAAFVGGDTVSKVGEGMAFVAVTGARGGLLASAAITALLVPASARWLIGRSDLRST